MRVVSIVVGTSVIELRNVAISDDINGVRKLAIEGKPLIVELGAMVVTDEGAERMTRKEVDVGNVLEEDRSEEMLLLVQSEEALVWTVKPAQSLLVGTVARVAQRLCVDWRPRWLISRPAILANVDAVQTGIWGCESGKWVGGADSEKEDGDDSEGELHCRRMHLDLVFDRRSKDGCYPFSQLVNPEVEGGFRKRKNKLIGLLGIEYSQVKNQGDGCLWPVRFDVASVILIRELSVSRFGASDSEGSGVE